MNDSFALVSQRLEQVYKGLGEMQTLAVGVGDLKKVLSNVKTRGTLGELQLGAIIEQILSPEQYARNVNTKPGSGAVVEFAVKLPGDGDQPVWLPFDSKYPGDAYEQLLAAYDTGDAQQVEQDPPRPAGPHPRFCQRHPRQVHRATLYHRFWLDVPSGGRSVCRSGAHGPGGAAARGV